VTVVSETAAETGAEVPAAATVVSVAAGEMTVSVMVAATVIFHG
jgi:hypothetical protein